MRYIYGNDLHPDDRAAVLDRYVYRMTVESVQRWPDVALYMHRSGYRMPARTDAEWLLNTRFAVRRDGRLDRRARGCYSTW